MRKVYSYLIALALLVNHSIAQDNPSRKKYCSNSILPAPALSQGSMDSLLIMYYRNWRDTYIKQLPGTDQFYTLVVDDKHRNEACVSESQGYGMMIVAMIGQKDSSVKSLYNGLFRCFINHLSPKLMFDNRKSHLMMEGFDRNGKATDGSAATDGDIDIAYSLLLIADDNWGSGGTVNYRKEAEILIKSIMDYEVNHRSWTLFLDNQEQCDSEYTSDKAYTTRPSDFIPNALRAFSAIDSTWLKVIAAEYALIDRVQGSFNGIIPDFIADLDKQPRPGKPREFENSTDGLFSINACRVPWRIAGDFLTSKCENDTALLIIHRFNDFMENKSQGKPERVYVDYNLDGVRSKKDNELYYILPFTLSAMCEPGRQAWLDKLLDLWRLSQVRFYRCAPQSNRLFWRNHSALHPLFSDR